MAPNIPDLKERKHKGLYLFQIDQDRSSGGGGGDSCVRRNKTSVFYFKKVEFLDMSHDCRLFNNDLHIVHENRNKFDLIGAKVHSIHNLLQTIFFLLCSICWNKYCELFSCADHE